MRFGALEIDPAKNPAILDTGMWDLPAARQAVEAPDAAFWSAVREAATADNALPASHGVTPYTPSCARYGDSLLFLAGLADGQKVFVEVGTGADEPALGSPFWWTALNSGGVVAAYPADAVTLDRFFRYVSSALGPKALGAVPRLGIGTRMTTLLWPAVWQAMDRGHFAANAIQNSVRELNLLDHLLAGRPPDTNYAFNFGTIESGYTGSTYEGLWVAGVLSALQYGCSVPYGADADHIQVKRGADGLARARKWVEASRYYTFFTLDVSDVLDYAALAPLARLPASVKAPANGKTPSAEERRAVWDYHCRERRLAGETYRLSRDTIDRLVGKYWTALDAVETLTADIEELKDGQPFDLELSIDEHPPQIPTFDCLTTDVELAFVVLELQRRQIPVTHVAPNFGVEKGVDYSCPDGLEGLERRVSVMSRICEELDVMVDFHSGDDLSAETLRVIRRGTDGWCHFKISPSLQLLFAETLRDHHPELFRRWWDDALAYATREAERGSAFAAQCLQADRPEGRLEVHHPIFHNYSFAFVGRRDEQGQFLHRHEFYDLSAGFRSDYQDRAAGFLCNLAETLFHERC